MIRVEPEKLWAKTVDRSWGTHGERLVRAEAIVDAPKTVQGSRLGDEGGLGRQGSFDLESEMHALVAAVLLGWPGSIRSTRIPSLTHQAERRERPAGAREAMKGSPLSQRTALGSPCLQNQLFENLRVGAASGAGSAVQASRKRDAASITVRGKRQCRRRCGTGL